MEEKMKKYKTITGDDGEKYIVPDTEINIADSLPDPVCIVSLKKEEPASNSENIEVVTGGEDNLCEAIKIKTKKTELAERVIPPKPEYHLPKDNVRRANIVREFIVTNANPGVFVSLFCAILFLIGCLLAEALISQEMFCLCLVIDIIVTTFLYVLMRGVSKNLCFYGVNKYTRAYMCHNKEVYKVSFKKVIEPGSEFNLTKFLLYEAPGQSLFYNIAVEKYGKDIFFSEQDAYAYIKYLNDTEEYNEAYNYSQLDEFYPEWQEDSIFKNFLRDMYQFKNSLFNVKDILEKYVKYQEQLLESKNKKRNLHKEIQQNLDIIQKYSLELQNYINKN